jgi:hypothetical protein
MFGGLEIRAIFIERLTQHGVAWSGSTLRYKSRIFLSSGCETAGFGIRVARVISLLVVSFPVLILRNSGMLLTS